MAHTFWDRCQLVFCLNSVLSNSLQANTICDTHSLKVITGRGEGNIKNALKGLKYVESPEENVARVF